jgi:hypothetical protein
MEPKTTLAQTIACRAQTAIDMAGSVPESSPWPTAAMLLGDAAVNATLVYSLPTYTEYWNQFEAVTTTAIELYAPKALAFWAKAIATVAALWQPHAPAVLQSVDTVSAYIVAVWHYFVPKMINLISAVPLFIWVSMVLVLTPVSINKLQSRLMCLTLSDHRTRHLSTVLSPSGQVSRPTVG